MPLKRQEYSCPHDIFFPANQEIHCRLADILSTRRVRQNRTAENRAFADRLYLVLEGESAMYRFPHWAKTHWNGLESELTSQKISRLFASVPEAAKLEFFRLQSARRLEKEYLAYDTAGISSYSELIDHVKYGYNKDLERLPQVNPALVFGEKSMLPVYFRKLPGNISDVKTVRKLLDDIDFLRIDKVKLVMDRGFYSADNCPMTSRTGGCWHTIATKT